MTNSIEELEKIFICYRTRIMENKAYIATLTNGELPHIKDFSIIENIIDFYNKTSKNNDWTKIYQEDFARNKEYVIHAMLKLVVEPMEITRNLALKEMEKYNRNYNCYKGKIEELQEELKKSVSEDEKTKQKKAKSKWDHDMLAGIFSVEEANAHRLLEEHIIIYKSKKTKSIIVKCGDLYDQFFGYYYMKLEYISSLALEIYPNPNKEIYWKDKLEAINKFPIGQKIEPKDFKKIIEVANYYKHQTPRSILGFPEISVLDKFLKNMFNRIEKNTNFGLYSRNIRDLYDEIDATINPLGLTGLE